LTGYFLAMALPAQDSLRTTYGIEAFLFSLAAAISFAQSNEMRLLFWGGYLNIFIICLAGASFFGRSPKRRFFEVVAFAGLIVAIINVVCTTAGGLQLGYYLWLTSSILFAFSTLLQLWFIDVRAER